MPASLAVPKASRNRESSPRQRPQSVSRADCGHADASITLNWYAHAMPGNDEQATNLLAAVTEHPEKAAKTA